LSHEQKNLLVLLIGSAQEPTKLMKHLSILARATPFGIFVGPTLWKVGHLGRFFSIVKQLVHGYFQSPCQLLKGINQWDRMPVFDARDIATEKTRAFFDFILRELLRFSQCLQSIAYDHLISPTI
jgi:hypothetical protein